MGTNIIYVARKYSQQLFCYMKIQTKNEKKMYGFENRRRKFLDSTQNSRIQFFGIKGSLVITTTIGTRLNVFYLILLYYKLLYPLG